MNLLLVIAVLAVLLVASKAAANPAVLEALQKSSTAAKYGLDNHATGDDLRRLQWLSQHVEPFLRVVRELAPGAVLSSAYRSPAVNEALAKEGYAPSKTSKHMRGLAFDLAGIQDVVAAAKHMRRNATRLSVAPDAVIAEIHKAHVHCEFFDPLGKIDRQGDHPTEWMLRAPPGAKPEYTELPA